MALGRWGRRAVALTAAAALMLSLAGCAQRSTKMETSIFAMDTIMSLTFYKQDSKAALEGVQQSLTTEIYALERRLSATDEDSEIYALNNQGTAALSPETAQLLEQSLALCDAVGGALDLTAYPAVQAWGFTSGDYRVPAEEELEELVQQIDYTRVSISGTQASLPEGMQLDLGAVAKGYAGDILSRQLEEADISSALLDLGQSTIMAIGTKPDGSPWRIAVQDPDGEGYLGVLELSNLAVGTSGGYQRYFEQDGETYWHIIDPATAAPARSGLSSVTVVSSSGLICDGLSTALFVMGLEEGTQFWRDHPELEFEALFVTEDGALYLTPGMDRLFSLGEGYEDREVTVLS